MSRLRSLALLPVLPLAFAACGGDAPPPAKVPTAPVAPAEPPVDTSAVPEPPGLIMFARVTKPDAAVKTVGGWAHFPLPGAADILRSVTDDAIADSVDMSQPLDAAAALGGGKRDPRPLFALSLAVKSYDDAKAKIAAKHKATPGKNGQITFEGIGAPPAQKGAPRDEDDDDNVNCVLAHAPTGGRLVCSPDKSALETLTPYLSRTLPRQQWPADFHMELTLAALREPIAQLRASLPFLARSLMGPSTPATTKALEALAGEVADIVNDTNRMTIDAQIASTGLDATMKVDYASANSLLAKVATAHPERADAPPAAFLHLPAETDLALYGRGSDAGLFDHMRELLGNMALEATEGAQMPEQERKAVRELVIDRMLTLFTGPLVYGKGYDAAALDKAVQARNKVKDTDWGGMDEADRLVAEQMIGWHLVQVGEPITKVGPILKDWSALWNKADFAKWAKAQTANAKMLAQMHTAPMPAGVTLPKDSVHLEIVIPRPDIEEGGPPAINRPGQPLPKPPNMHAKKIPVKPLTMHVIAVPDQGGTWVGFAMDAKLIASKAAASLSSAPDANTLGKSATADAFKDTKANGAVLLTLKSIMVYSALDRGRRSPYGMLAALTNKGQTPIVLTGAAQPPAAGGAGSSIAKLKIPSGAIEDLAKVALDSAR